MTTNHRILIVEDDDDIRETLREVLVAEGYNVEVAKDGVEAYNKLQASEHASLVLLDMMMPNMDGESFLAALKTHPELAGVHRRRDLRQRARPRSRPGAVRRPRAWSSPSSSTTCWAWSTASPDLTAAASREREQGEPDEGGGDDGARVWFAPRLQPPHPPLSSEAGGAPPAPPVPAVAPCPRLPIQRCPMPAIPVPPPRPPVAAPP